MKFPVFTENEDNVQKTGVKSLFKIYNDLRQTHFILDVFPLKL